MRFSGSPVSWSGFAPIALLCFSPAFQAQACNYDACVGEGQYETVGAAIAAAPKLHNGSWQVHIPAGDYREKLLIETPGVELIGEGQGKTVIRYDAYAGQERPDGSGPWTTWGSATVIVRAPDFAARDLSIVNDFDYPANDALPKGHPGKISDAQAVALMLDAGSDRALFERISVEGHQDTLFLLSGRSLFVDSLVSGNVDFIFGAGTGLFVGSEIRMRGRASAHEIAGYLTAASTHIEDSYGLVFIDCRLTREAGVLDNSTSLGRPWHPTTSFGDGRYADPDAIGAVAFIDSWMDGHIRDEGWSSMKGTARDGGREEFLPGDARFFEYANSGPGVSGSAVRRQLSEGEVDAYRAFRVLGDWRPRIPLPLPREPVAYTPENELRKHGQHWPGIALVETVKTSSILRLSGEVYASVDGRELRADVYYPANSAGSAPGVVLVHGGGWRSGARDYLAPFAQALAARGYVAATVDYRLSREALYPAALDDIGVAVEWLRGNAPRFAMDPDRVALLGTSAGAHLASLAAVTMSVQDDPQMHSSPVQALVNIDGVVDMVSPAARKYEDAPDKTSAFGLWIGGRYADYPELWREASPLTHLSAQSPPTLFINSAQARFHVGRDDFVEGLAEYGTRVEVHTLPDTPHTFWLFDRWFPRTLEITADFLRATFQAPRE